MKERIIRVLELDNWVTPVSSYNIERLGNHRIVKHTFWTGTYSYHGIDGYSYFIVKKPLTVTKLEELTETKFKMVRWKEWMVDSPTDYRAMQKYAKKATGIVLTSGLGLGLLVNELCKRGSVD